MIIFREPPWQRHSRLKEREELDFGSRKFEQELLEEAPTLVRLSSRRACGASFAHFIDQESFQVRGAAEGILEAAASDRQTLKG
jgi:hypothetical protein